MFVFEKLHGPFVLFGRFSGVEHAKILAFSSLAIEFSRIEPILTRFEFANHCLPPLIENKNA
jgi:hypothetical protein